MAYVRVGLFGVDNSRYWSNGRAFGCVPRVWLSTGLSVQVTVSHPPALSLALVVAEPASA